MLARSGTTPIPGSKERRGAGDESAAMLEGSARMKGKGAMGDSELTPGDPPQPSPLHLLHIRPESHYLSAAVPQQSVLYLRLSAKLTYGEKNVILTFALLSTERLFSTSFLKWRGFVGRRKDCWRCCVLVTHFRFRCGFLPLPAHHVPTRRVAALRCPLFRHGNFCRHVIPPSTDL